ncbi:DNA/RNA non-specific endonuclease [Flocculibacter collagenilyticus]|uniref:DNA/RNA non-specific endonuclease n=1 Tax=Flocculibacter collagenilyticus TaxID=2744479 RepID=UPI0018F59D0A|nr:DNA/RNA non-specific endonuclease [Flocculibacter collagenilyticus]
MDIAVDDRRDGYDEYFLSNNTPITFPRISLALAGDVLHPPELPDDETVIPYIHYSIVMSKSTKQALYSAANVDNNAQVTISGSAGRRWFVDSRIGKQNQIVNDAYVGTPWDRGHLTRRTAVTWGDYDTALAASNDSCSYANASMQHKRFNEDEWRLPEKAIADFQLAKHGKLIVMTGPIFTTCDRYYAKRIDWEPVRIPSGFWKTVSYLDNQTEQLVTAAYILFQDIDTLKTKKGKQRIQLRFFRVTTTELQLWTGLEFDHKMFDSNPLKFYSGPEAVRITSLKEMSDESEAILAAGIVDQRAIHEARKKMALSSLYDLIDELSWF